jgi:phosphoribosylanthranilate isomerase
MTKVKICCISSVSEAKFAMGLGATAIGLVSNMPSGPGVIPESLIAEISAAVLPPVTTVLLTSFTDSGSIVAQQKRCAVRAIQLVDKVEPSVIHELHQELTGIQLIQVIHVGGDDSVVEATEAVAAGADALLLDSGNQKLPVKQLGGTGRTHDWSISAMIVDAVGVPVYLAGGLNPDNVGEAIRQVRPYGVDVCSGVRTDNFLDQEKLSRFMEKIDIA